VSDEPHPGDLPQVLFVTGSGVSAHENSYRAHGNHLMKNPPPLSHLSQICQRRNTRLSGNSLCLYYCHLLIN